MNKAAAIYLIKRGLFDIHDVATYLMLVVRSCKTVEQLNIAERFSFRQLRYTSGTYDAISSVIARKREEITND